MSGQPAPARVKGRYDGLASTRHPLKLKGVAVLATVLYLLLLPLLYPGLGEGILAVSIVPVALIALAWGFAGGLLAGILSFPLHLFLLLPAGESISASYVLGALGNAGNLILVLVGALIGALRDITSRTRRDLLQSESAMIALRHAEAVLERRVREMEALYATMVELRSQHELEPLLSTITERAAQLLNCTAGAIFLADPLQREVRCVVAYNTPTDQRGMMLRYGEGAAGLVAESGEPLIIDDYCAWEGRTESSSKRESYRSLLSVPLIMQGEMLGVIHVMSDEANHHFTRSDLELLLLFSAQAAAAVESARRLDTEREQRMQLEQYAKSLRERERFLSLLNEITRNALITTDVDELLQLFVDRLAELFGADDCYITLWDEGLQRPLPAAAHRPQREMYAEFALQPEEQTITETVLRSGRILPIENTSSTQVPSERIRRTFPAGSLLGLPLIVGEEKLGAIIVAFDEIHPFDGQELQRAEQVAGHVALALHKLLLLTRMQQLALTDPLTGLYNRRGFLRLGEREIDQARRYQRPLCVLTFDIDRFKWVNDSHGHSVGDEILVGLTQRLQEELRAVDLLGRYGGEEFVILLPETGEERGAQVAERLREAVSHQPFPTSVGALSITISLGVAAGSGDCSLATLLDHADRALYRAKQAGRNRVAIWQAASNGLAPSIQLHRGALS